MNIVLWVTSDRFSLAVMFVKQSRQQLPWPHAASQCQQMTCFVIDWQSHSNRNLIDYMDIEIVVDEFWSDLPSSRFSFN